MRLKLVRALLAALLLTGCAGLPRHVIKYQSVALRAPQDTTLGHIVARAEDDNPRTGTVHPPKP